MEGKLLFIFFIMNMMMLNIAHIPEITQDEIVEEAPTATTFTELEVELASTNGSSKSKAAETVLKKESSFNEEEAIQIFNESKKSYFSRTCSKFIHSIKLCTVLSESSDCIDKVLTAYYITTIGIGKVAQRVRGKSETSLFPFIITTDELRMIRHYQQAAHFQKQKLRKSLSDKGMRAKLEKLNSFNQPSNKDFLRRKSFKRL